MQPIGWGSSRRLRREAGKIKPEKALQCHWFTARQPRSP
jgi:hypothetical protein